MDETTGDVMATLPPYEITVSAGLPPGPWTIQCDSDGFPIAFLDADGRRVLVVARKVSNGDPILYAGDDTFRAIEALPALVAKAERMDRLAEAARRVVTHARTGGDPWSSVAQMAQLLDPDPG
jgi:hypothetical protein